MFEGGGGGAFVGVEVGSEEDLAAAVEVGGG